MKKLEESLFKPPKFRTVTIIVAVCLMRYSAVVQKLRKYLISFAVTFCVVVSLWFVGTVLYVFAPDPRITLPLMIHIFTLPKLRTVADM